MHQAARSIATNMASAAMDCDRIEDLAGNKRDAIEFDDEGYTRLHAEEWDALLDEAVRLADAIHALRKKMERP
jgi:hypothetical protein